MTEAPLHARLGAAAELLEAEGGDTPSASVRATTEAARTAERIAWLEDRLARATACRAFLADRLEQLEAECDDPSTLPDDQRGAARLEARRRLRDLLRDAMCQVVRQSRGAQPTYAINLYPAAVQPWLDEQDIETDDQEETDWNDLPDIL